MRSRIKQLLLWSTLIFSLNLLVGCSNTDEGKTGDSSAVLSSAVSKKRTKESNSADVSSESFSSETSATEKAGYGAVGALSDSEMTVEDMLVYAIQDEYLAHREYTIVLKKFGDQNPFNTIVLSEEQHIAELIAIFEKYGFAIQADESAEHVIVPTTVKEGLENCSDGEVDNIAMYNKFLELEIPEDVRMVFTSLRNASERHLKSFQQNLEKY